MSRRTRGPAILPPAPFLPPLLTVSDIRARLLDIFDEDFPDRNLLVGIMAARVVFVFLYGGFIDGTGWYLRPSNVYLFTKEQSKKVSEAERTAWLAQANRPGFRPSGERWYADTSRESIRDDLLRNQFYKRLGIVHKRSGVPTTASTPVNALDVDFARLFDPTLIGPGFAAAVATWRAHHLDAATLQRAALRGQGVRRAAGDVLIDMPDGTRIRIAAGPSSPIAKGLIEDFATRHLSNPAVLWLSASDNKAYPQYVALAESVGLEFDLSGELPDLILADLGEPVRFVLCEIVATDGAVTEERRRDLLALVRASSIPESNVAFLSAFDDRESSALRKNFSRLALGSLAWFRTEPDLLVTLTTTNRAALVSAPNVTETPLAD